MCLILKKRPRLQTAKKDIEVVKWTDSYKTDTINNVFNSEFFDYGYRKDAVNITDLKEPKLDYIISASYRVPLRVFKLHKGFHNAEKTVLQLSVIKNCYKKAKFIIPKGAKYYTGLVDDWHDFNGHKFYVSNTIIFKEFIE